jgi:hypothetical protein
MKLSQNQIDLIDRFLEQHQLDFLDFKLELKDHLATATETIMKKNEASFDEAFLLASQSWHTELQVKKYWLISNERLFPNIVIQKIKHQVAIHYAVVLLVALICSFNFAFSKSNEINLLFKYSFGFCGIVYFLMRRVMNYKSAKTSFRFHFDYFHLPVPVLLVFFCFIVFKISFTNAYFIGFLLIANFPFSLYYFLKHQQFIKKYNLI